MFLVIQSLQKTVRKCVELEQVIVTFRLKMKFRDQFQNNHAVKLNEVFLQNKWLEEGDKTKNTLQVPVQIPPKNITKMCNL